MGVAIIIPDVDFSDNNLGTITVNGDYTVSYSLTSCTINDMPSTVNDGESLSLALSPLNTYCSIDSVVITMGGVDVTSSAYSNGNISIASCSGNITITASAAYNLPAGYTQLAKLSVSSGAYFDTGITASANSSFLYKLTINSSIYYNSNIAPHVLSSANYYAPLCWGTYNNQTNGWFINRCGQESVYAVVPPANMEFEINAFNDGNKVYINDTCIEIQAGSSTPSGTLYFGCYGGSISKSKYYFVGEVHNEIVIRNSGVDVSVMVPCKDSNNLVGFYDVVRDTFYSSSTSVAFTE